MKKNVIHAQVVKGIYKDSSIEIHLSSSPSDCHVYCNGKELDNVICAHISITTKGIKAYLELRKKDG